MKHILIIVAHPKNDSLSFAMANTYKENAEGKGNSVEILDLYRDEHQQQFFTYSDANALSADENMKYYQDKMAKADEIVFVFPYWWGSFPAILKNFFDWNLSKGFAFEYVGSRPKGLLTGKTVRVFTTTGSPKFIYDHRRKKKIEKYDQGADRGVLRYETGWFSYVWRCGYFLQKYRQDPQRYKSTLKATP